MDARNQPLSGLAVDAGRNRAGWHPRPVKPGSHAVTVALVLLVAVIGLVALGSRKGLRVTTSKGGREVMGTSRNLLSAAHVTGDASSCSLTLGEHTAQVSAEAVTLADGRVIAIPPACKRVELHESGSGLVLSFDGVAVP